MDLAQLDARLAEASDGLAEVTRKRMFGCDAYFANETIYGLVWKDGRLGLKLPDPAAFDELMAMKGAAPWTAGDRTMARWVLVPEAFHKDDKALRRWVEKAHALAAAAPAKAPKKPAAAKGAAPKKAAQPSAGRSRR